MTARKISIVAGLFLIPFFFLWRPSSVCAQASCTVYEVSVGCGEPGGLCNAPSPTPTPTPEPLKSWIKVQSTSFYSDNFNVSGANNYYVPRSPFTLRTDGTNLDSSSPYMQIGSTTNDIETGVARIDGSRFETDRINSKGWVLTDTDSRDALFSPNRYLDYAKTRKDFVSITDLSAIQNNRVNIYDPEAVGQVNDTVIISNATILNKSPYVLIVDGNLTITTDFNTTVANSIAIVVTGTLTIDGAVQNANALFFVNDLLLPSSGSPDGVNGGLQIVGNLIVYNGLEQIDIERTRAENERPTVFIVQQIPMYLQLLPYFSTANYEWRGIQ